MNRMNEVSQARLTGRESELLCHFVNKKKHWSLLCMQVVCENVVSSIKR